MTVSLPFCSRRGAAGTPAGRGRLALGLLALLLLASRPPAALAQTAPPAWQLALSGNNNQPGSGTSVARAAAADASGNVFVTGNFSGTVSFGSTRLVSAGSSDVFVAKWDATAQAFTWAVGGGGSGADIGQGIAVSGSSVYVTGSFAGNSATLAGQTLTNANTNSTTDIFVAKYLDTSTGSTPATSSYANGWAVGGGGTGADIGYGIAASGTSVYVTGVFASGTSASVAGQALTGAGGNDVFVAKYVDTSAGSTQSVAGGWATSGGGTGNDQGYAIAASGAGVYVTGFFASASATLAGQTLTNVNANSYADVFVAKYLDTSTGSTAATSSYANGWAVGGGGAANDMGQAIAVSGTGVYVTGYFASTSATLSGQTLTNANTNTTSDVFVAKYVDTSTGSTTATSSMANGWAVGGGGTASDQGQAIAVSGTGVYVTGSFGSTTATLSGQTLTNANTNASTDAFVAKYTDTSAGSTQGVANGWAAGGGGTGTDAGYGLAVSSAGVYAAGQVGVALASFGAAPATRYAPASSALLGTLSPATGTWQQATGPLTGGSSQVRAVATDARGNVFLTGNFSGTVGFGGTRLVSAGSDDIFVAKWDATTQAFTWAASGGGTGSDYSYGLAVSGTSVYVTGVFASGTGASLAGQALTGTGSGDIFVAKYLDTSTSSAGSYANGWAISGGGANYDIAYGLAVSGTSVYITGFFGNGSATLAGQTLTNLGTNGSYDVYVAKYVDTSTGSTQSVANGWAVSGGSTANDIGQGIAVSGSSVYVTGSFGGTTASFAGQTLTNTGAAGTADVFVAKYLDQGASAANGWAAGGGGTANDIGFGLAVSGTGVYVTGYFSSNSISLAGQTLTNANTNGSGDIFVAKYVDTSTGSPGSYANGWATRGGGTGNEYGYAIAASGTSVYVTGYFDGATASFAGRTLTNTGSAGSSDVYVAKYVDTSTGSTQSVANGWAVSGGGTGLDQGYGLALSGQQVYAAGYVGPPATFGSLTFGNTVSGQINFLAGLTDGPPTLRSLSPASGTAGSTLAASGTNLQATSGITFTSGSGVATAAASGYTVAGDGTGLTGITVPTGLAPGPYTVVATSPGGPSNGLTYTVVAPPTLTAVAPNPGGLGQAITLTGTYLGSPTALTINGANALGGILSSSGSTLVVRVPVSAAAAGTVSVTTAAGTATLPFSLMAVPGNALAFDGVDDYLALPNSTPVPTGNSAYTLEAWIKPNAMGVEGIIGWGNWGTTNQVNALRLSPTGIINYWWGPDLIVNTPDLSGRWHHVAATFDGTTRTIYLDGVAVGSDTPGAHTVPTPTNLRIGSTNAPSSGANYEYFNGSLDEVRVYTVGLTPAQVQADMTSTTPAVPASLSLYLNFDQGTPAGNNAGLTTLYDLSPNATPATLTNFALSSNASSNYVASDALVVPTATAATSRTPTSFIATWLAPANGTVTSYLLDVATTPDFSAPVSGSPFTAPASATSYGVTGLTQNTTYYYRVRALNSALAQPDQGTESNMVSVATPLPVALTQFTATAEGRAAVRLAWATASEKNSLAFEVERSADGASFARIGTVAAAGTTATAHSYALPDAALPTGASVLYYRLRQVDLDGSAHYSPVRVVALGAGGVALFPNPAHGAATLTGAAAGQAVTVLDAVGRVVATATADASGTAALALPGGVYVVRAGAQALRLVVE